MPTAPAAHDPEAVLAEIDRLATLLDSRHRIPGTSIRFGLDAILGLLPGVGDAAAAAPALYLIWRARQLGVPRGLLLRMIANVGLDTAVGSVPLAGGVFDLFFKANRRNQALLRRHFEDLRDGLSKPGDTLEAEPKTPLPSRP
jgi:hypothetical protein